MGARNYLVECVSGTGKTAVCQELTRRGFQAINGDRDLAYQGDPATGEPIESAVHGHHIWDLVRVRALVANHHEPLTFFCGGSRNFSKFIDLFDAVFVLDVDLEMLHRRLDQRPPDERGSKPSERDLIVPTAPDQRRRTSDRTGDQCDATAHGRRRRNPSSRGALQRWGQPRVATALPHLRVAASTQLGPTGTGEAGPT